MSPLTKLLGKEGEHRAAKFMKKQGCRILERNYNKTDLDKILISDRAPEYRLLWALTKTLSKRLRETNENMAGFLAMSGGF